MKTSAWITAIVLIGTCVVLVEGAISGFLLSFFQTGVSGFSFKAALKQWPECIAACSLLAFIANMFTNRGIYYYLIRHLNRNIEPQTDKEVA